MSKVHSDDIGLFLKVGGYIARPFDQHPNKSKFPEYGIIYKDRIGLGNIKAGDNIKASHIGGSSIIKIKLDKNTILYWFVVDSYV